MARARQGAVRVGCSGWHYAGWAGVFYDPSLPKSKWLEAYGEILNLFNRSNFRAKERIGGEPGFDAGYQAEPSCPRLPSYGVRIMF